MELSRDPWGVALRVDKQVKGIRPVRFKKKKDRTQIDPDYSAEKLLRGVLELFNHLILALPAVACIRMQVCDQFWARKFHQNRARRVSRDG